MRIVLTWRSALAAIFVIGLVACGGGGGDTSAPTSSASFVTHPAVAAGAMHTLALKADGTVWAWGSNTYGQLGRGGIGNSTPSVVAGLDHVVAISARGNTSMALRADGTVWTWGYGGDGQLGIGGAAPASNFVALAPVQAKNLTNIQAISMGYTHAMALRNDGTIWVWGSNAYGQLGLGDTLMRTAAFQISGVVGVTAIAAGGTSSVAQAGVLVLAWGDNSTGQLGQGTTASSLVPVPVSPQSYGYFSAVALGRSHVLSIAGDYRDLVGWGFNASGQVGDDSFTNRTSLSTNAVLSRQWTAVAAGEYFSVGLDAAGIWTWGDNAHYQLGIGFPAKQARPTILANSNVNRVFTGIAAGNNHGVALSKDGRVWTWGLNDEGQLGRVTSGQTSSEAEVPSFNVLAVAPGPVL